MRWVMLFLIQQEDREDERQRGLQYKLKSFWIHHINMIMRATCDQSKFNCLSGGLLVGRFPDPSIQRLEVTHSFPALSRQCFQKQVVSQLSPENKNWKGHRPGRSSPLKGSATQPLLLTRLLHAVQYRGSKTPAITYSREKSSHFVFPFQSTKPPCMRTHLPA